MFYVYEHIDPETGKCFYVGKCCNEGRMNNFKRTSAKYKKTIENLTKNNKKPIVKVVCKFENEQDALKKEKELILFYGIENLCNMVINGGGRWKHPIRKKMTEETREKISKTMKGRVSPMKGKKHTIETIEKMKKKRKNHTNFWEECIKSQRVVV